jgi:3-oxoacyl-[acyl-carrier-protein] synthase-3
MPTTFDTVHNGLHYIRMNGREVFRFATRVMAQATREAVEASKLKLDDIHLVIPHQANKRIIEAAARGMGIPMERVAVNLNRYGNTSTASIPLAACESADQGKLNNGDYVALVGFGAGLTWGAVILQWTGPFSTARKVWPQRYRWLAKLRSMFRRFIRHIEGLIWGRD